MANEDALGDRMKAYEAQGAGKAVCIRIILAESFQHAYVGLSDEATNILVVLVTRLGLYHGDLFELARLEPNHAKLGYVAVVLMEPFRRPWAGYGIEISLVDAVPLPENSVVSLVREQPKGAFKNGADLVIDR